MKTKSLKRKMLIIGVIAIAAVLITMFLFRIMRKPAWDTRTRGLEELRQWQNEWVCGGHLMKSEDGYLYTSQQSDYMLLYRWDGVSDSFVMNCSKANCKHTDETCSAYYASQTAGNFQCNNGYIFYTVYDDNNNICLYRSREDGTEREKLEIIGDGNQLNTFKMLIHYNHVFVYTMDKTDEEIFEILDYNMEKKKAERVTGIYKGKTGETAVICDIEGQRLLYSVTRQEDMDIYIYDYESGENTLIKTIKGSSGFVRFADDSIVYTHKEGNKLFLIDSPQNEKILNTSSEDQLAFDGTYIYR